MKFSQVPKAQKIQINSACKFDIHNDIQINPKYTSMDAYGDTDNACVFPWIIANLFHLKEEMMLITYSRSLSGRLRFRFDSRNQLIISLPPRNLHLRRPHFW